MGRENIGHYHYNYNLVFFNEKHRILHHVISAICPVTDVISRTLLLVLTTNCFEFSCSFVILTPFSALVVFIF